MHFLLNVEKCNKVTLSFYQIVDFWALGILIYEMLVGRPPYHAEDPYGVYELILNGKIEWPKNIDLVAKDLIKKLLVIDR